MSLFRLWRGLTQSSASRHADGSGEALRIVDWRQRSWHGDEETTEHWAGATGRVVVLLATRRGGVSSFVLTIQAQRLSSVRIRRLAVGPLGAIRHEIQFPSAGLRILLRCPRSCPLLSILSSTVCVHEPGGYRDLRQALAPGASGRALRMHDPCRQLLLLRAVGLRLRVSRNTITK